MKTLAIVPAREHSKGIPGKNLRLFGGVPLVQLAITVGLDTCDMTLVTTDSPGVVEIADRMGVMVEDRAPELATDDTPMLEVLRPIVNDWPSGEEWVIVLLQPTQPFRTTEHVKTAIGMLEEPWDSVVTVTEVPGVYNPMYVCGLSPSDGALIVPYPVRRQDVKPAYSRDGTAYVMRREIIEKGSLYGLCRAMIIPGAESAVLDTEADWKAAVSRLNG